MVIILAKLISRILLSTLLAGALSSVSLTAPVPDLLAAPASSNAKAEKITASSATSVRKATASLRSAAAKTVDRQPVSKEQAARADKNAYRFTAELLQSQPAGQNLVFSPYSLQQALNLIEANTRDSRALEELAPYADQTLTTEKLRHTKTGGLILLDKRLAPHYQKQQRGDLKLVQYPGEALAEKIAFQERILGSVIDEEPPQGHLNFLTAAHYFAEWAVKFDKKLTQSRPFTTETDQLVQVPTMKKHFEHEIGKITPDYELARVSAKAGAAVYFIKPLKKGRSLAGELPQIISGVEKYQGTIHNIDLEVPKISLKQKSDLRNLLRTLGLKSFFNGNLTFEPITGDAPYVLASASQTATLDVNEDYAEGKALTEIGFRLTSAGMIEEVHYLKMDQPYFIVIKDQTQDGVNRVVFTAWVANPK